MLTRRATTCRIDKCSMMCDNTSSNETNDVTIDVMRDARVTSVITEELRMDIKRWPAITSEVIAALGVPEYTVGQTVCVSGWGTSPLVIAGIGIQHIMPEEREGYDAEELEEMPAWAWLYEVNCPELRYSHPAPHDRVTARHIWAARD